MNPSRGNSITHKPQNNPLNNDFPQGEINSGSVEEDCHVKSKKKYNKRGPVFHNRRKYHKQIQLKDGWRLRCARTKDYKLCNGRGTLLNSGEFIQNDDECHSTWCKPEMEYAEQLQVMKECYLRDVAVTIQRPRRVFDQHLKKYRFENPRAPPVDYKNFKNPTRYAKRKVNPPQPKNLEEMHHYLTQEHYQSMLKYNWKESAQLHVEIVHAIDPQDESSSASLVFSDRDWVKHVLKFVEHTVHGFSDGTFRIKPSKIKCVQLLKFEVACFNQGAPLAYALMERRTTNDYEKVVECIVNNFAPELSTLKLKLHVDFEAAEHSGWKRVLSSLEFVPCRFHYDQIQWRNAKRLGALKTDKSFKKKVLSEKEKQLKKEEDEILIEVKNAIKMILGMPILPLEMKADDALLDKIIQRMSVRAKNQFVRYAENFRKNWLTEKRPPEMWNVADHPYQTNNISESGNRLMNSFFPYAHPQPWDFVKTLVHYHDRITAEFQGSMGTANLKKQEKIEKYSKLLLTGKIQRIEFLTMVTEITHERFQEKFEEQVEVGCESDEEVLNMIQEFEPVGNEKEKLEHTFEANTECNIDEAIRVPLAVVTVNLLRKNHHIIHEEEEERVQFRNLKENGRHDETVGRGESFVRGQKPINNTVNDKFLSSTSKRLPRKQKIETINREGEEIEFYETDNVMLLDGKMRTVRKGNMRV